ncbi:MAG TPA: DNA/RNA nuclease SfsA [Gammaproteobacteria bacterium]|nr:DNA/RNA nuclease SfsA [Gammaproteobacteria bacterium]
MEFESPLLEGTLERRYKRFLADVRLSDGSRVTAHCPNTGSMMGCMGPGSRVWLRDTGNRQRKYPLSWELVEVDGGTLVGINTARSNALVREAIEAGVIAELRGYLHVRGEVRYGNENSRIDLLLEDDDGGRCYVEVKNVTAAAAGHVALFPDAVSTRGTRHLRELAAVAGQGDRAVIVYCVQRGDVNEVRPADDIDPDYGRALRQALDQGVQALAYQARISPAGIALVCPLPVVCPGRE